MHFTTATAALFGLATTSLAATVSVKSQCNQPLYLTYTNSSNFNTQYPIAVNGSYSQPLGGKGNQFGITKDPNYFSASTPKFVFGYSDSTDKLTYWSVSAVDGNPFDGSNFLVSASEPSCTTASTYDGQVHTCTETVCNLHLLSSNSEY